MGSWEYAGNIGNVYRFAHAKYGANPLEKTLIDLPTYLFGFVEKVLLGLSALRAPAVGP